MIQTADIDGPVIDTNRRFYVSAINSAGDHAVILLGPFDLHSEALDKVSLVKSVCFDLDSKAPWYRYGTCSLPLEEASKVEGKLNNHPKIKPTPPPIDPFD